MVAAGEMGCNPGIHHLIKERRTNEYDKGVSPPSEVKDSLIIFPYVLFRPYHT